MFYKLAEEIFKSDKPFPLPAVELRKKIEENKSIIKKRSGVGSSATPVERRNYNVEQKTGVADVNAHAY